MRPGLVFAAALMVASPPPPAAAFEISEAFGGWFTFGEEGAAPDARSLTWEDLAPDLSPEAKAAAAELNNRVDAMTDEEIERALEIVYRDGEKVVQALDGETVALTGYLVPLDFEATEARTFVLVPYIGACIHVPPPPPNQIVFVEYEKGIATRRLEDALWKPFRVTGRLSATPAATELAEVGYQLHAAHIARSAF